MLLPSCRSQLLLFQIYRFSTGTKSAVHATAPNDVSNDQPAFARGCRCVSNDPGKPMHSRAFRSAGLESRCDNRIARRGFILVARERVPQEAPHRRSVKTGHCFRLLVHERV